MPFVGLLEVTYHSDQDFRSPRSPEATFLSLEVACLSQGCFFAAAGER